jgi:hypothetical protein
VWGSGYVINFLSCPQWGKHRKERKPKRGRGKKDCQSEGKKRGRGKTTK